MFDDLTYKGQSYQTKSLDCVLDDYELRDDGTLWHQTYRIEDRSDPTATGIRALAGMMTKVPTGWEQVRHTGEVEFHRVASREPWLWEELVATFVDGKMVGIVAVNEPDVRRLVRTAAALHPVPPENPESEENPR